MKLGLKSYSEVTGETYYRVFGVKHVEFTEETGEIDLQLNVNKGHFEMVPGGLAVLTLEGDVSGAEEGDLGSNAGDTSVTEELVTMYRLEGSRWIDIPIETRKLAMQLIDLQLS